MSEARLLPYLTAQSAAAAAAAGRGMQAVRGSRTVVLSAAVCMYVCVSISMPAAVAFALSAGRLHAAHNESGSLLTYMYGFMHGSTEFSCCLLVVLYM
jgi:hypothetical protein